MTVYYGAEGYCICTTKLTELSSIDNTWSKENQLVCQAGLQKRGRGRRDEGELEAPEIEGRPRIAGLERFSLLQWAGLKVNNPQNGRVLKAALAEECSKKQWAKPIGGA